MSININRKKIIHVKFLNRLVEYLKFYDQSETVIGVTFQCCVNRHRFNPVIRFTNGAVFVRRDFQQNSLSFVYIYTYINMWLCEDKKERVFYNALKWIFCGHKFCAMWHVKMMKLHQTQILLVD